MYVKKRTKFDNRGHGIAMIFALFWHPFSRSVPRVSSYGQLMSLKFDNVLEQCYLVWIAISELIGHTAGEMYNRELQVLQVLKVKVPPSSQYMTRY